MNLLKQIQDIYRRNKWLILGILVLVILLQWCHNQTKTKYPAIGNIVIEQSDSTQTIGSDGHPLPLPGYEQPSHNPWLSYFIMVGLVLLVFIAQRRRWFVKLLPGFVLVRMQVKRHPINKRRMLHVYLLNTKAESQTFDLPVVEFLKYGNSKAFRIRVSDDAISFPITLTHNTSHKIVIDLDQFYDKVDDLKRYRWVRVKITINGRIIKKSFPRLVWLFVK